MTKRFALVAAAALSVGCSATTVLAQSASFEAKGFPITLHQAQLFGFADLREQSVVPVLTAGTMPASVHQIAVLTPRKQSEPVQLVNGPDTTAKRLKKP